MGDGPGYEMKLKRRRNGRTDYKKRLELLKAGKPRAVIRTSNNHTQVQLVEYSENGDRTVTAASSDDLDNHGWDGHTGNLTAAYLTGFLAGYRARSIDRPVDSAIPDFGVLDQAKGGRHYAAVKGLQDAGIDIPGDPGSFPAEERLRGTHLDDGAADTFEDVMESIESTYGDV